MTVYQKLTKDIDRLEADAKIALPGVAGKCQEDAMALTVKRDALSWDEADLPADITFPWNSHGQQAGRGEGEIR